MKLSDFKKAIKGLKKGDSVRCLILGIKIEDAKITFENWDGDKNVPFICQNKIDGVSANDKFGYKYSWVSRFGGDVEDIDYIEPI